MSYLKETVISRIIAREGGYVNDSCDSGGETKFGVTKEVARANGYEGEMCDFPRCLAESVYIDKYWDAVSGDYISSISEKLTEEIVDTAVNMGVSRAGKFLQRALNALNNRESHYSDIAVDGQIGSNTIEALWAYYKLRGEGGISVLLKTLNGLQVAFYVELVESREKDEKFLFGWIANRIS